MRRALMLLVALWAAPALAQQQPLFPRRSAAPQACVPAIRGNGYFNTTSNLPFVCDGSTWVDITVAGTVDTAALEAALPVSDATALVKGSGDPTKKVRLEADGCATGTTCALTVTADTTAPIASQPITLAGPTAAVTWTGDDAAFTFAARNRANAFTTTNSFIDDNFTLLGSSDASKSIRVEVDGLTTATQRVIRPPDADTWLPVYTATITYTGATAARTVIYPDQNFAVAALDGATAQRFTGAMEATGTFTMGGAAGAAGSCTFNSTSNCLVCEGTVADAFEASLCFGNPGLDTTFSLPALVATATAMTLEGTQSVVGAKTFGTSTTTFALAVQMNNSVNQNWGTTTGGAVFQATPGMTPDWVGFYTGTAANAYHIAEVGDIATDLNNGGCGTAACADPSLVIHSSVADTTQYQALAAYGRSGGARKTLTESAATSVVRIPVAASEGAGGTFSYCVFAKDATDQQQRCADIRFSVTNKAATETCGLTALAGAADASITELEDGNAASISASTLTYAITCDVTPANAVDIQINAASGLTQTTLEVRYMVELIGPGQPARQ